MHGRQEAPAAHLPLSCTATCPAYVSYTRRSTAPIVSDKRSRSCTLCFLTLYIALLRGSLDSVRVPSPSPARQQTLRQSGKHSKGQATGLVVRHQYPIDIAEPDLSSLHGTASFTAAHDIRLCLGQSPAIIRTRRPSQVASSTSPHTQTHTRCTRLPDEHAHRHISKTRTAS
jgi:hypothetical protein